MSNLVVGEGCLFPINIREGAVERSAMYANMPHNMLILLTFYSIEEIV